MYAHFLMTQEVQRVSWVSVLYHQILPPSSPPVSFQTPCAHTFPTPYKMAPREWLHILTMAEVPAAYTTHHLVYSMHCLNGFLAWPSTLYLSRPQQPSGLPCPLGHPILPLSPSAVFLSFQPLPPGYLFLSLFPGLGFDSGDCWFSGMDGHQELSPLNQFISHR